MVFNLTVVSKWLWNVDHFFRSLGVKFLSKVKTINWSVTSSSTSQYLLYITWISLAVSKNAFINKFLIQKNRVASGELQI